MTETRDVIARQIAEHTVDSLKCDGPKQWIEMLNLKAESDVVSHAMKDVAKHIERRVRFLPAYDKRKEGHGRHGVEIQFGLLDLLEKRAATLVVYTGWTLDSSIVHNPSAAELSVCRPLRDVEKGTSLDAPDNPCAWHGEPCLSDHRNTIQTHKALETLIKEGSEGLWKRLEELLQEPS